MTPAQPVDPLMVEANWRASSLPMPDPAHLAMTLCESLQDIASRHPDQPAIVSLNGHVTFAELVGQAGALSAAICDSGTQEGPVALLLPAGVSYIAAWFACAAAGRPMLMVELANPPARNAALLEAAGATLVLHDGDAPSVEAAGARASLRVAASLAPRPLPSAGLTVEEVAFLFATSGSSGLPKLVVYSQATVQAKVQCSAMVMGVGPGDTVMIAGSHANFGVLHHALVFLFRGGTLCLHDMREGGLSGMFEAIERFDVNHLRFTPSLFRTVVAMPEAARALRQARCVRFAGEPLLRSDIDLARAHLAPDCAVQNLYGSTESMIFFWSDRTEALPPGAVVPNGRIYPVAEFMLLGDDGMPALAGGAGELVIRSRRQALGDWLDGRVDPARFPPDPLGSGRRLYYTGDVARVLPDGTMIVLGRKDRLLKVNGQRVSLLEIEATLRTMPGCVQATVQPRRQGGATQLVAFLVTDATDAAPSAPDAWLAGRLPRYMVPARFVRVTDFPLLPGGKVDGRALLAALSDNPDAAPAAPPDRDTETLPFLRAAWAQVLGVAPPGLDADFFGLGGDSLKLLELTLAVERRTGRPLSPAAFLETPTIRGLAGLLERQATAPARLVAPRGTRFDARGRVALQRVRHAQGISHGLVVGMPGLRGHAVPVNVIAANALQNYEVWAFVADLGGREMVEGEAWLACAMEIADQLAAMAWLRPRALFGFSIGGYIGWLVDRILAGRGGDWWPGRVITIDSGPLHARQGDWRAHVDPLIADSSARPGQMLLLHRRRPVPFRVFNDMAARWSDLGVPFQAIGFRTLSHTDMNLPRTILAAREVMAAFVETGCVPAALQAGDPAFNTLGGQIHRLLTAGRPPEPTVLRAMTEQPDVLDDRDCRLALLFLLIAVGDQAAALDFAHRITGAHPHNRAATYAVVGLLSLQGDLAAAASVAAAWCRDRSHDHAIRKRIEPAWCPAPTWGDLAGLEIGSDASLDRVLDMLAAREGLAAA